MSLAAFFEQNHATFASRWIDAANAVYPFATVGFLRTRQDPFSNPVGQRSHALAEILFRAVAGLPHDGGALRLALEEFVRVRAIQDAPAETSLAAMFAYKKIIRDYIRERNITIAPDEEPLLLAMDERCDTLALLAFGMYARLREAFFTARIDDMRRRHSQVMRLAKRHGLAVPDDDDSDETAASASGDAARQ